MNFVARRWHAIATVGKQQHQRLFSQVSKGHFYCQVPPVGAVSLAANFLKHILSFVGIARRKGIESNDEKNQFTTLSIIRETLTVNTPR